MNLFKKSILAAGLAASALATTTPAMARDYYRGHDNTAAVAIGAGILGLAVGAIAASSNHHDRYYDGDYYDYDVAYAPGWSYRDGYYWDRGDQRFSREEYFRRNPDFDHRGRHGESRRGFDHDRGDFRRGY